VSLLYYSQHPCIIEGKKYIEKLNWWLVPVHGFGEKAKSPLFGAWPDFQPGPEHLEATFEFNADAGLGVNLGASGLIDLESDTPEGEKVLVDLCRGVECPQYQSRRSVHRLFQGHAEVEFLKVAGLDIEFRTGRHQSVIPPSIIGGVQYQWLVSPFDCPPPPITERILDYYMQQRKNPVNERRSSGRNGTGQPWPYRDQFDYVLQHFDLMEEAEKAGLIFVVAKSDGNGNVPCHVPSQLRGANDDDRPSGSFNVYSGVLRDFATGQNHLFFNLMAALTGERWQAIFKRYEAKASPQSGRPHSRRISYPSEIITPSEKMSLAEARERLADYIEEQFSRPPKPKTLHLIKGQPGLGKTYTTCQKLGEKGRKAIVLTLENRLAQTHDEIINRIGGGKAQRMPVLRDTHCPFPDEYEATSRRGFIPKKSLPCRKCPIGPRHCRYLLAFSSLKTADQLCAAAVYHTHDGFYEGYGNESRPIVVFDENSIDVFLEPTSHNIEQWKAWGLLLRNYSENNLEPIFALVDWLGEISSEFAAMKDRDGEKVRFHAYTVPVHQPRFRTNAALEQWLNTMAHRKEYGHVHNLYNAAAYLLSKPDASILLQRIVKDDGDVVLVRFLKKNPLPEDKEVFILDATANEELLRAVAPDWELRVWDCPPIEQKGKVIQIMDYDISRSRIKREVERHDSKNPSWLAQTVDNLLETHGPAALITFKGVFDDPEMDILGKLKHRDKLTATYNFPCRGHSIEEERLIVLGTPYKNQGAIWELAMALGGVNALPMSRYAHRIQQNGYFISENMGYAEPHFHPITQFLVSAELSQAIGRVRPLQNDCTVFVISNAPIPDWDIEQFTASELFDVRNALRRDAFRNYEVLSGVINGFLANGQWLELSQVRCAIDSQVMSERTLKTHWGRYKVDHKDILEVAHGKIRLKA